MGRWTRKKGGRLGVNMTWRLHSWAGKSGECGSNNWTEGVKGQKRLWMKSGLHLKSTSSLGPPHWKGPSSSAGKSPRRNPSIRARQALHILSVTQDKAHEFLACVSSFKEYHLQWNTTVITKLGNSWFQNASFGKNLSLLQHAEAWGEKNSFPL